MGVRLVTVGASPMAQLGYAAAVGGTVDIELVGQAAAARDALPLVDRLAPDVVVLDVELPDTDGLGLGRQLRADRPELGVVVIGPTQDDLLFRVLEARFSAYLPRSAEVAMVLSAVRHAAVAPSSFTAPDLAAAVARRRARATTLSPRELEILRHLRDGHSNAGVATALRLTESTVRTYVSRLYDKLGVQSREQALAVATRQGLLR